jgi:hypothetical protein
MSAVRVLVLVAVTTLLAPQAGFARTGDKNLSSAAVSSATALTVVAGAPASGVGAERADVYDATVDGWSSSPTQTITSAGSSDFGAHVAISADGKTAVVGEPGIDAGNGAVLIYTESGGTWSNVATINGVSEELLGNSVAVSADGSTIVVGAYGAGYGAGTVFVYTESGSGWANPPGIATIPSVGVETGTTVAVSGDGKTVVVGTPNAGNDSSGEIDVYTNSGTGWSNTASFTGVEGDALGASLAISAGGRTIVAGAPGLFNARGKVLIYALSGSTWANVATYTGDEQVSESYIGGDQLGSSVTVSSDGTTVAAVAAEGTGEPGEVFVYSDSSGAWSETGAFFPNAGRGEDESVLLTADGGTIVVGAADGASFGGELLAYRESDGAWPVEPYSEIAGVGDEALGTGIAISAGGTIFAGAPYTDGNAGQVNVYEPVPATNVASESATTTYAPDSQTIDLHATVSSAAGPVDEGTVTFTIIDNTFGDAEGTASGPVTNGSADVPVALTGAAWPGRDTIEAAYSDDTAGYANSLNFGSTLTITPQSQVITFAPLTSSATAGTQALLSATGGGSGEPVDFEIDPSSPKGVCSVSPIGSGARTVYFQSSGTCVIDATQAGSPNGGYSAAMPVSRSVVIGPAAPVAPIVIEPIATDTPTAPVRPSKPITHTTSSTQIASALNAIAYPSGEKVIAAMLRSRSFKTRFDAPSKGSLSIIWTTTVTSGKGKHKKHKTVTMASGSVSANSAGTINVALHLTGTGESLLKKKPTGLSITSTEGFRSDGLTRISVTKKISL